VLSLALLNSFKIEKQVVSDTTYQVKSGGAEIKKALPINHQKSSMKKLYFCKSHSSDLSIPLRAGFGTLLPAVKRKTGCQGFIGPFPSAFLDKRCSKELMQR
jgi:hypothetical protein